MAKQPAKKKATDDMKTVDIKGKDYVMVNDRIKYFREHFEGYGMISKIIKDEGGDIVFMTTIVNKEGNMVANGHAKENQKDGFINKTSHYENAETSSWGRALANFGIGVDASVASADEVANAIKQQSAPVSKPKPVAKAPVKEKADPALDNMEKDFMECKTQQEVLELNKKYPELHNNESFKKMVNRVYKSKA